MGREGLSFLHLWSTRFPKSPLTILNDGSSPPALPDTLAELSVVEGEAVKKALMNFEVVVKSPGISRYRPEIQEAREKGVLFTSTTALWFAEHQAETIVAVTGTKGKSTTASVTAHLLRKAGRKAYLAGNIGLPVFDLLDVHDPDAIWVIELSSYQICDIQTPPKIAVLLNLYAEHNDWHGSVEQYFRDKTSILGGASHPIVNSDLRDSPFLPRLRSPSFFNDPQGLHVESGAFFDGNQRLFPTAASKLLGAHNHVNICAALAVLKALGGDPAAAEGGIGDFCGLPHRLQVLGVKDGATYIDDSISTIPEAALAAVAACGDRLITLLLGGYQRAQDWQKFAESLSASGVQAVITMPDSGAKIAAALRERSADRQITLREASSLTEAVRIAQEITPSGGVILLSPAAPSYGHFANFEERGNAFKQAAGL